MSRETAFKAIDFLASVSDNRCTVTFFGGEPLLEFDLMKGIVQYAGDKYGDKIAFRLSTNATLLEKHHLDFFEHHGIYFVVSIDGNREQHDSQRCDAAGHGSYDHIVSILHDVLALNPYTVAVSVVVPETAHNVRDGVESLFDLGFRYVLQTLDYSADWTSADLRILRGQYSSLAKFYFKSLREGRKIYYSPFDERIKTRTQKPYKKGDLCDLANSQIAIAPSGVIYPCVQLIGNDSPEWRKNSIGDVEDGFNRSRRKWFVDQNYTTKESCTDCSLDGRCSTYCGCVNWRATGSISAVPPIICEHERMLMPIVDKLANKLWSKNIELFKRKFYDPTFPCSSYIEDCKPVDQER